MSSNIALDFQKYWLAKELETIKRVRRIEGTDE